MDKKKNNILAFGNKDFNNSLNEAEEHKGKNAFSGAEGDGDDVWKLWAKIVKNGKILVSNGKSIVIKTNNSYYLYPLERTPLNLILDKKFLVNRIQNLDERVLDDKFVNFKFFEKDFEVNIFFDYNSLDLVGWQTTDIYQNLSITFLDSVKRNQNLNSNLFVLPKQN